MGCACWTVRKGCFLCVSQTLLAQTGAEGKAWCNRPGTGAAAVCKERGGTAGRKADAQGIGRAVLGKWPHKRVQGKARTARRPFRAK